jgi:hypothetical protein
MPDIIITPSTGKLEFIDNSAQVTRRHSFTLDQNDGLVLDAPLSAAAVIAPLNVINVTVNNSNVNYPLVLASGSAETGTKTLMMDGSGGTYNPFTNTATIDISGNSATTTLASNSTNLGGVAAASYVTLTGTQTLTNKTITGTFTGNLTGTGSWATNAVNANTATNSTQLNGQSDSYYTNIPARLGYTPVNKAGDTISGNLTVNGNFAVNGSVTAFSASNIYITSSNLTVTDNILLMNALSPYQRYAGIQMHDSGSGTLSQFLWDGDGDYFFLTGSSVNGKIITGPDGQTNLSSNYVPKATAGYKLGNSLIYDNGTNVGIGTTTPSGKLSTGATSGMKLLVYDNAATGVYTGLGQDLAAGNSTDLFAHSVSNLGFITFGKIGTNGSTYTEWARFNTSGSLGIGTTSPNTKLAVNGVSSFGPSSKLSMIGLDINSGGTPTYIKIVTTIPVASPSADFTVNIKGFVYGAVRNADISISWHYYLSTFYNPIAKSSGGWAPTIRLSAENGFVAIVLSSPGYWPKFYVESMYSSAYTNQYASGWSWTDADATGNPIVNVPYASNFGNGFVMLTDGNVGIGTTGPGAKLDVNGNAIVTGSLTTTSTIVARNYIMATDTLYIQKGVGGYQSYITAEQTSAGTGNSFKFWNSGTATLMTIGYNGYVGIGTTSPTYQLHVNGGPTEVGGQVVAAFEKQSSTDGKIATFVNTTGSGYTSYIYIGSNPGRDWKIGKNVLNSGTTGHFQITNDLNQLKMQINASDDTITFPSASIGIGVTSNIQPLSVGNSSANTFGLLRTGVSAVAGNTGPSINFYLSQNATTSLTGDANLARILANPIDGWGGYLQFFTKQNDGVPGNSPVVRMTINTAGNVGIGTTTPTTPLHVVGVISGSSFSGAGTGLTGTAASLTAGTATIANGVATGAVKSGGLEENSVITSKIADGNVTNVKLASSSVTIGSSAVSLGSTLTTIAGLTSVTSTTFVGALTGTGSWATNAVTALNGGVTSIVAGTSISISGGTGAVTVNNSSPNATHTGDVTGATTLTIANDAVTTVKILNANVTNAKLANSSVTIGSTAISLGATATTIAGLTSVTSTTFVGALTGTATTASYANGLNATNTYTVSQLVTTGKLEAGGNVIAGGQFSGAGTGLTGTASGLSIGGSAATATSASFATTAATATSANSATIATSVNGTNGQLLTKDVRTIAPNNITNGYFQFGFTSWTNNNNSPYADYLHLRSYTDSSGGNDNLVMFRKDILGMRIWQQTFGSANAYSTYKDVCWADGTNASGTWAITSSWATNAVTALNVGNGTITIAAGTGVGVGSTNTFTTNQSGATTVTISNSGVTSNVAGTGISLSGGTGAVTITNSGVTSAVAGTGVGVSAATGAVTFSIGQAVGPANTPSFAGIISSAVTNYAYLQVVDTNNFWITPGNANWGLYFETSAGGLLGGTGDSNRLGFVGAGTARFYVDLNNGNGWFGGALTAAGNISAANLSGTNTGDQTIGNGTITIAAGTGVGVGSSNTFTTNQSGATTVTITNTGVTAITTNTGLSTNTSATGAVTITNTGVTSAVAGTGVSVSAGTGAVTFSIGQAVGTGNSPTFAGLVSNGNIGIGTSTLDANCLATFKTSNTARVCMTDGTTRAHFWPTGGNFYISTETASDLILITNANERMRIQSGGNVGVGTSTPGQKLDVEGRIRTRGATGTGGFEIGAASSGAAKWRIEWDSASDSLDFNWVG